MKAPFLLVVCAVSLAAAQPHFNHPPFPAEDRIRIEEVYRLANAIQDDIWKDWSKAPFALLLVTPDIEFLTHHPHATNNFDTTGFDKGLNSWLMYRKRLFDPSLIAAFPAINGYLTVVAGQPELTNVKNSTAWVTVILHEHFHQLQMSKPNYMQDTQALDLSGGDQTGMWMLNYPFPYDSAIVQEKFAAMCTTLSEALAAPDNQFPAKLQAYRTARSAFKNVLKPHDYKYFSFQLWQEGVSRYTEWRVAKLAAEKYKTTTALQSLKDYKPFSVIADSIRSGILSELPTLPLGDWKRVVFYSFGAAEAILLDRVNPNWQDEYFMKKFDLEAYYK